MAGKAALSDERKLPDGRDQGNRRLGGGETATPRKGGIEARRSRTGMRAGGPVRPSERKSNATKSPVAGGENGGRIGGDDGPIGGFGHGGTPARGGHGADAGKSGLAWGES